MRRASWAIGLMVFLLAPMASAEGAKSEGERWDHRHMKTRYRSVLSAESRRTDVSGADRYGRIATPAGEAEEESPDLATVWTQRPWEPGGPKVQAKEAPSTPGAQITGVEVLRGAGRGSSALQTTRGSQLRRSGRRVSRGR